MSKRICRLCNKSDTMTVVIDKEFGITNERRLYCFSCMPVLPDEPTGLYNTNYVKNGLDDSFLDIDFDGEEVYETEET